MLYVRIEEEGRRGGCCPLLARSPACHPVAGRPSPVWPPKQAPSAPLHDDDDDDDEDSQDEVGGTFVLHRHGPWQVSSIRSSVGQHDQASSCIAAPQPRSLPNFQSVYLKHVVGYTNFTSSGKEHCRVQSA